VHKNYYEILGVSKDASSEEIKKSYRKLSKQYHPDVNPSGDEMFKKIAEAYSVLGDEQKRQQYDNPPMNPFGGSGGAMDFDEFLRNMGFGGDPFARGGGSYKKQPKVPDTILDVIINPIESYKGGKKEINFTYQDSCEVCSGTGGDRRVCDTCKGNGFLRRQSSNGMFNSITEHPCPTCKTSGYQVINSCYGCNGVGTKRKMETISVELPRAIDDGDFLRVGKKGNFFAGHGRGDLILKIVMKPADGYEKMGLDLIYTKKMTALEFIFEEKLVIPHPDGDISIFRPDNIDTEKPLRMRGKGYQTSQGSGNMYLKFVVYNDTNINKEKLEKLKKVYSEE
jgi:molecular chaperone DnaJ